MRGTWVLIVVLSLVTTSSALARGKKSRRHKPPAEIEAPAEPAPEPVPEPLPEEPPPDDTSLNEAWGQDTSASGTENQADSETAENEDEDEDEEDAAAPTTPPTWWFGAYLHGVWVPGFMLGLFLDGPPTVSNPAFGAQVTHRDPDGFSWVLGLGYVGYGFEGPFQKKGDPDEDTEWVKSSLGLVHVSGAILWSTQLHEMLSFEYGIGVDFGVVTGQLERTEAYRASSGAYAPCASALNPPVIAASGLPYCEVPLRNGVPVATNDYDEFGAHYHVIEKRVPPVALLPALPQLALRFSPHRNFAVKLEAAYGIFQFWFGLSAAYGADI